MRHNFFKNNNSISGFTMVELLVSISIVGLMAAMVAVNFRAGSNAGEVRMAAQKLASDIRLAQSYAMNLKEKNGLEVPSWGIDTGTNDPNNSRVLIFADINDDQDCDNGEEYYTRKYAEGVTVSKVNIVDVGDKNWVSITFKPPDPEIIFCFNNSCEKKGATITLSNTSGDTASVFINAFGLVDVQN